LLTLNVVEPCMEEIPKGVKTIELMRKLAEKPNGE
jgi:hypothetical protein